MEKDEEVPVANTERKSNFELLRIFAMFLIVSSHWAWAFLDCAVDSFTAVNYAFYVVLRNIGQLGVILYVIISGYFLCKSKFKIQSFIRIILQVFFIACFLSVVYATLYTEAPLSKQAVFEYLVMLTNGDAWFVLPYIFIFLLSPFLNTIVKNINKKQFLILLSVMFFFVSIFPTIIWGSILTGGLLENSIFFIFIYFLGAYIRLYNHEFNSRLIRCFGLLTCLLSAVAIMAIPGFFKVNYDDIYPIYPRSSPLLILCAVFIFLAFKELKIKNNKFINIVAASTFGVYLLHENFLTRQKLWRDFLHLDQYIGSAWFILISIGIILSVFVACSVVDILRKYLLEKPLFRIMDKKCWKIFKIINRAMPYQEMDAKEDIQVKGFWFYVFALVISTTLSVLISYNQLFLFICFMLSFLVIRIGYKIILGKFIKHKKLND